MDVIATSGWYPDRADSRLLRWWNGTGWTERTTRAWPVRSPSTVLIGLAIAWGVVLIALAALLPVYTVNSGHPGVQPRHSLVAEFGIAALVLSAMPLVAAVLTGWLLRLFARNRRTPSLVGAWIVAGAVTMGALTLFLTILIGVFAIPAGMLLCAATFCAERDALHASHRRPLTAPPS